MRLAVAIAALVVLLAGCGGSDEPSGPTGDAREFPGSGQPLSHYKGKASYPWRVAIVDQQDEIVAAMQAVYQGLDVDDLADVVETCDTIARGISGGELTQQTATRFGVDFGQAAELVLMTEEKVCP